jgi:probable rRNA maturation factor
MSIIVKNLNKKHRLNERFLEKIAASILKILKKQKASLDIVFITDAAIRPINKRYKGRSGATDVLSFELGELGEIIISSDAAVKNSHYFKTDFEKELVLYMIHGILHLFGYDDETAVARARMSKKQNSILENICAEVRLSKVLTRP